MKPLTVGRIYRGQEIEIECHVTERIRELYQAGKLATGDFDKPIAVAKASHGGGHPTKDDFSGEREVEIYVQAIDATKKAALDALLKEHRDMEEEKKITCTSQRADEEPEKTITVERACGS